MSHLYSNAILLTPRFSVKTCPDLVPHLFDKNNYFKNKNATCIMLCSLENAVDYRNDMIVYRFIDKFNISFEDAGDIFNETKKWLWLCALASYERGQNLDAPKLSIDKSILIIDMMWHNFILFTRDYEIFCIEKFGSFVHHVPLSKKAKDELDKRLVENQELINSEMDYEFSLQCSYIYDKLGERTLIKWYDEYPIYYSEEKLKKIMI